MESISDPAPGHLPDRDQELLEVGNALLEQVGTARSALLQEGDGIGRVVVLAEQDHAGSRAGLPQVLCRPDALVRARGRHADIGQDDIGLGGGDRREQGVIVLADGHQLEVRRGLEEPPDALPDEIVVLGEDHPNGHGR